jgi:hypothetical protein
MKITLVCMSFSQSLCEEVYMYLLTEGWEVLYSHYNERRVCRYHMQTSVIFMLLLPPLVSFGHCNVCSSLIYSFWLPLWYLLAIVLSFLPWFTASDYLFGIFRLFLQWLVKRYQRGNQKL